jgi:LysR family transcriptional regulator, hydrogen peroxide-inducible genes activator
MKLGPFPLTLRQLQYVVAVAEAKSFRRAAEACHVSQPSLSAQIKEFEAALNVRVFERDRRRVLLTAAGSELVDRARRVLLESEDLVEAAKRYADPFAGTLRVGVIPTIGPYLLPEIDPTLRKTFPLLTLQWTEDKTEELVRRVDRGALDAILVAGEADLGDLKKEVLGRDPFVLATSKQHALAHGRRRVRIDDLRNQEVLLLDDGHCFRDQALDLCAAAGSRELGFRATSLGTLSQMVAGGAAITLLPRVALEVENRGGLLAIREFARPEPHRTIVLAWRPRSALEGVLHAVAESARAAFRPATSRNTRGG